MRLLWSSSAWDDYEHWVETDLGMALRLHALLRDIRRDPFRGIGKPEPLKGDLQGFWSRRIDREHRLVYRVSGTRPDRTIEIAQCRYHYDR